MVKTIGETILKNEVSTVEEVLSLSTGSVTVNDLIINETATIGEKLSLRRFALLTKMMMKFLEVIYIWVEELLH